jgi:hypothetical protein
MTKPRGRNDQIPKPKSQSSSNDQTPNPNEEIRRQPLHWDLELGVWDLIGIWDLGFGH